MQGTTDLGYSQFLNVIPDFHSSHYQLLVVICDFSMSIPDSSWTCITF